MPIHISHDDWCRVNALAEHLPDQEPSHSCLRKGVSILDGDPLQGLHNHYPERIRLSGIDCPVKGQAYANAQNEPPQSWFMGRKSSARLMGMTSTNARLPMCIC